MAFKPRFYGAANFRGAAALLADKLTFNLINRPDFLDGHMAVDLGHNFVVNIDIDIGAGDADGNAGAYLARLGNAHTALNPHGLGHITPRNQRRMFRPKRRNAERFRPYGRLELFFDVREKRVKVDIETGDGMGIGHVLS